MFMVLPPLAVTRTASAIVAPLGAASGFESVSVGDRLRAAICTPPTYTPPGDDFVLAQAIVVHRHGDRAPISQSAGSKLRCDASTWAARLVEPPEHHRGALVAQRLAIQGEICPDTRLITKVRKPYFQQIGLVSSISITEGYDRF